MLTEPEAQLALSVLNEKIAEHEAAIAQLLLEGTRLHGDAHTSGHEILQWLKGHGMTDTAAREMCVKVMSERRAARGETPPPSWSPLLPEGRSIYYEGDNPDQFVEQIKSEFGFDPSADPNWGKYIEWDEGEGDTGEKGFYSYGFHCPAQHLDAIYGSNRWPLGS